MIRKISYSLAMLSAAALAAGCGGARGGQAPPPPSPAAAPAVSGGTGASTTLATAGGALPSGVTAAMVAVGDSIFNARQSCSRCHGEGGTHGRNGPDLTTGTYDHADGSYASILKVIEAGVPKEQIKHPEHRFPMRPRGGLALSDAQTADVAAYVWTLGHKS